MAIYEFEGKRPEIHPTTYVDPDATIIGDVIIGENCYIGPGARIRGDWGIIRIASGSNVQDNCVLHANVGGEVILGPDSHIGHGAVLHSMTLKEHVTVGMNAVILDYSVIGAGSLIGAGSVVRASSVIPPKSLVLGVPGKVVSEVSPEQAKGLNEGTAYYHALPKRYYDTVKKITD